MTHTRLTGFLAVALSLVLGAGCGPVGKNYEQSAGAEGAEQVRESIGLVSGEAATYVETVGLRLVERAKPGGGPYRFHVANMAEPNAFALPGGYVYVSRGMLALLNTEDELANVLAHEIGHVAGRHHLKSAVRRLPLLPVSIATAVGATAVGIVSRPLGRLVGAVGSAPGALFLASYSRGQENEADELGQGFAAAAGFDPAAMPAVMETLAREEQERGGDPERQDFFATHPTSPDRARKTAARAAELVRQNHPGVAGTRDAFLGKLDGLLVGDSGAEGAIAGARFLHADMNFRVEFPAGWKPVNRPEAVVATAPDDKAAALLALAPKGQTPLEAAHASLERMPVAVEEGPVEMKIGALPAARAVARAKRDDARLLLTWIAHQGQVFQLAALCPADTFAARRAQFEAIHASFGPLRPGERAEVREARLRLFRAGAGDTFESLVKRNRSPWKPSEAAVANALEPGAAIPPERLVKLAVLETYAGAPAAP